MVVVRTQPAVPTRLGAFEPTGDEWWMSEGERLLELSEAGATLTSVERAAAERERTARDRRKASPVIIPRESINFEPSSHRGVEIGHIIAPGKVEVRNASLEVYRLLPRALTDAYRHCEAVIHILSGTGYSIIDGRRYDWGPHDSLHIQNGAWFQHGNSSDTTSAYMLVSKPTPIFEHISSFVFAYLGDDFSDPPDDYQPEHPFTKERVSVGYVDGKKWMSKIQHAEHHRREADERHRQESRVLLKADEAVLERSEHKGDWRVGLVDQYLGFDNRLLGMYVHQMPPLSYTETHKHSEAIVYVLSGRGHSIVEGERYEWRAGDCIFVQPNQWHQHFNDDDTQVSQHLAILTGPMRARIVRGADRVEWKRNGSDPIRDAGPERRWWT
jgi:gentisate 1,2-dioxygenase